MKMTWFRWLVAVAPFILIQSVNGQNTADGKEKVVVENPAQEVAKPGEPKALVGVIQDSVNFSILTKALAAAGLEETLGAKGAYTVFAPTDEAFDKLPPGTLGKLMLPENKEKLRSLLLYHVLAGRAMIVDLKEGKTKSMNGELVEIDIDVEKVKIEGRLVYSSDVMASNGVMHSIGEVLVPPTLDGFLGLDR